MTYTEPTDEQLVNFAAVLVSARSGVQADKPLIEAMFERRPETKRRWLEMHRQYQEQADALGERSG